MPCEDMQLLQQEIEARERAFADLQKKIVQGKLILEKAPNGSVRIRNWGQTEAAKSGWHESCVLAATARRGTWAAKQRLAAMLKPLGVTAEQVIAAHDHEH